jgi:hypothetical protein
VQQRRLPRSQPTDQLEEVIEEVRELMLRLAQEVVSRRKLNRGGPARAARKQQQQQQQHIRGVGGQLQGTILDSGGFPQWSRGSHE